MGRSSSFMHVPIGIGQGMSLVPLAIAGVAGVATADAGVALGAVNAAHQLGGSLGLGVLVVIFAIAGSGTADARVLTGHRISAAFTACAAMLALAFALAFALIVRPDKTR